MSALDENGYPNWVAPIVVTPHARSRAKVRVDTSTLARWGDDPVGQDAGIRIEVRESLLLGYVSLEAPEWMLREGGGDTYSRAWYVRANADTRCWVVVRSRSGAELVVVTVLPRREPVEPDRSLPRMRAAG